MLLFKRLRFNSFKGILIFVPVFFAR